MVWKLKVDEKGLVVMKDDLPVFLKADGTEVPFDAEASFVKVGALTHEAAGHRVAKEAAETKLLTFGDIDPTVAKKNAETVAGMTTKEAEMAARIETVRTETAKAVEERFKPVVEENGKVKTQLESLLIGQAFQNSTFIKEKISEAVPRDMLQATFAKHVSVKDGKVFAKDASGNDIFSPTRPGEVATFDEALGVIVGQYPGRDAILKGTGANGGGGTGSRPGGAFGASGRPVMTRQQLNQLDPGLRPAAVAKHDITD